MAKEIHKLAESSGQQVRIVSQVLKKITGALARISASAGTVIGNFEDIDRRVNEVLIQEKHILDAYGRAVRGKQGNTGDHREEVHRDYPKRAARLQRDADGNQRGAGGVREP